MKKDRNGYIFILTSVNVSNPEPTSIGLGVGGKFRVFFPQSNRQRGQRSLETYSVRPNRLVRGLSSRFSFPNKTNLFF